MHIVLMILAFIWWWPLGLVVLGLLIARRRLGYSRHALYAGDDKMFWHHGSDRWDRKMARMQQKMERVAEKMNNVRGRSDWFAPSSSGNHAFDDYRAETLRRLEDEQREFKEFLGRLRFAKDRAEFDQFMNQRRQSPSDPQSQGEPHN